MIWPWYLGRVLPLHDPHTDQHLATPTQCLYPMVKIWHASAAANSGPPEAGFPANESGGYGSIRLCTAGGLVSLKYQLLTDEHIIP